MVSITTAFVPLLVWSRGIAGISALAHPARGLRQCKGGLELLGPGCEGDTSLTSENGSPECHFGGGHCPHSLLFYMAGPGGLGCLLN